MDVSEQLTHARNSLQDLETALNTEKDGKQINNLALKQAQLIEKFELLGGYDLEARAALCLRVWFCRQGFAAAGRVIERRMAHAPGFWPSAAGCTGLVAAG